MVEIDNFKNKIMNKSQTGYLVKRKLVDGTFKILQNYVVKTDFDIEWLIRGDLYTYEVLSVKIDKEHEKVVVHFITHEFPDYDDKLDETLILHQVIIK